ncbi:hypothetical protein Tco_0774111 [Tanacetum coccineum]|uniref:Xylulose kinase-1 n=1 Tax=Tanacetum coccineum TaxID=301880 RepID=A0ABQ4ZNI1_9ASTR
MVINSPCLIHKEELAIPGQTTTGKEFPNPLMAGSLPKTISTKFAETHNLVAFLEKPVESEGFEQIVDFLNTCAIKYALTVNPTIYTSCIQQFWATAKTKTVNGEVQLQALVDGKKVIITETSVRRVLKLKDAEGIECLPNATIF